MNARLLELAEKAGVKMNCYGQPIPISLASNWKEFAELLVRECAQRCDPIPGLEFSAEAEAARAGCRKDILNGFGVEE